MSDSSNEINSISLKLVVYQDIQCLLMLNEHMDNLLVHPIQLSIFTLKTRGDFRSSHAWLRVVN